MPKLLTNQQLAQCFRELIQLRAAVREAERDIEQMAKDEIRNASNLVARGMGLPVVLH
ncbi:conserved hypothetical protein [Bradyrhizobium sp. STM 3843]|uniref:hypothetical protein n=1 Tax=Bradyrhizobium sp. STM 3843 TaxID=551947 RepID=UPI000240AF1E|nr:hypothetical protein [Bradyrhizobium sp. STM 3843]CCE05705.1 conserved hypothetical protein [Bradyrhizobium sp. STM 3843]